MNILNLVPIDFMEIEDLEWPGHFWNKEDRNRYNHFEVVIIDPSTPIRDIDLLHLPSLQLVITASTGTNHINKEACAKYRVDILSLLDDRESLSEITASSEFTFFLILAALRRIHRLSYIIYARKWFKNEEANRGNELCGKDVGIIGMGRIGRNIFKWVSAFNANVIATYDPPAGMDHNLGELFQNSDIVVISCELNENTIDMIRGYHIQSMKKGACVINTSRGEVVREKELVDALNARPDILYVTDVLAGETKGTHKDSRLFDLPNCIITPHIAGLTYESNEKAFRIANKLLWRWYGNQSKEVVKGQKETF